MIQSLVLVSFFWLSVPRAYCETPNEKSITTLSQHRLWHRLLHYKKNIWGGLKSEADGPLFFLSPHGQSDPKAELKATIDAMQTLRAVGRLGHPAPCVFPARLRFIRENLGLTLPDAPCSELTKWREGIRGRTISIVFSSYFANAPASIFGHTFLKINSKKGDAKDHRGDILDYAIDFSAITGEDHTLIQAFKGLFGYYEGHYSMWPYYIKIKEYNNAEHRDLFEYEIIFTEDEMDRLLDHLWELGNTHFNYYFLSKNCSYQPLALLEAAKPDWDLTGQFIYQVIPIDTVRAVLKFPGSLNQRSYRPSLSKKIRTKFDLLSDSEKSNYFAVIQGKASPEAINNVELLDAINLYYLRRQLEQSGKLQEGEAEIYRTLLLQRSKVQNKNNSEDSPDKAIEWPELAHASNSLYLELGKGDAGGFVTLADRPALHDLLNMDYGYPRFSKLEFFHLNLRYYTEKKSLTLHKFTPISIVSFTPYHPIRNGWNYSYDLNIEKSPNIECIRCYSLTSFAGIGESILVLSDSTLLYTLIGFDAELGLNTREGGSLAPAIQSGIVMAWQERAKTNIQSIWTPVHFSKNFYSTELKVENAVQTYKNNDLRFAYSLVHIKGKENQPDRFSRTFSLGIWHLY